MAEIGLFEAIYSARAIRRLKPDPVPNDVLAKVLDAAIRAPSGSNGPTGCGYAWSTSQAH